MSKFVKSGVSRSVSIYQKNLDTLTLTYRTLLDLNLTYDLHLQTHP
jgi:hypothetical protein